jgi:aminoglycoside phosphotransferase (APT) family kinase protein
MRVSPPRREHRNSVLDIADVPGYLLERGLLRPRDVVEGELRVSDTSRLNTVFIVTAAGRRPLVVKAGPRVAREVAVLERLHRAAPDGTLAAFLPSVVCADAARGVLVLESPAEARDLARHHARGRFSRALASEVGRGLAALHATPPTVLDGLRPPWDGGPVPRVHLPDLEAVHSMSPAATELTRIIQRLDDLCTALDEITTASRGEAVVHGDVRWDNLLAIRSARSRRWTRLGLIDWEHCEIGDPAVDIGAFLGEYLRAWALSVPVVDPLDPGRLLADAGLPLHRMRPALRTFWDAYAGHCRAPAGERTRRLRRAVDLAAVRLLVAALEEAETTDRLRAHVLHLVSLSHNLLCRRGDASARLLGLAAAWGGA